MGPVKLVNELLLERLILCTDLLDARLIVRTEVEKGYDPLLEPGVFLEQLAAFVGIGRGVETNYKETLGRADAVYYGPVFAIGAFFGGYDMSVEGL